MRYDAPRFPNLLPFAAGALALAVALGGGVARADDTDIFGSNVTPNVLILFDNSGSMDDEIASNAYDPGETYPGAYTNGAVYRTYFFWYTLFANSIADVSDSSARASLSTDGYWSGRIGGSQRNLFTGNYLNYQSCSSCQGRERKIDIAQRAVTGIVENTAGVNFGVMKLRDFGGTVIAPLGTDVSTIVTQVNALTPASWTVGTPIGDQFHDASLYYKGQFGYPSPITQECQPNFCLMISDGLQRDYTRELVSEAAQHTPEDHSALAGTQNLVLHTVGFAIAAAEADAANDVLEAAAAAGGGSFYSTNNAAELEAALQDAIRQIVQGTFSFASPLIPTTSTTGSTKAFLAAFKSDPFTPRWRGYLTAYQRNSTGLVPVDADGMPLDSAKLWEAGALLAARDSDTRTIYTSIGGTRQTFTVGNANVSPADLNVAPADRDDLIALVRGVDTVDEDRDGNVSEDRAWKLGDIFHSAPVLVGPPPLFLRDPDYLSFKAAQAARTPVIIAGANDGMMHAFRESDGVELWGYVPETVLPRLQELGQTAGSHPYFVDSSPVVSDVETANGWKTVLVYGLRRGGSTLQALDITDTEDPLPMWSVADAELGETWSVPAVGRVEMNDGTLKHVAFIGGGYDTGTNNASGRAFFAVDMETGSILWKYHNDGNGGDRQYMNFSLAAAPTIVDNDGDGDVDTAYIGDVGGQVWKFDMSTPAILNAGKVTNWTGRRLFAAAPGQSNPPAAGEYYPSQAIYGKVAVALDKAGDLWIAVGTGDRNHPLNSSTNMFVALKDDGTMTNGSTYDPTDLANVTTNNATSSRGWYFTLGSDEKVLDAAEIFNSVVYFSSFTPTSASPCDNEGGEARLYAVKLDSGYAALDLDDGSELSSSDASTDRSKVIGSGIPSSPIMTMSEDGSAINTNIVLGTTSGELPSTPTPPPVVKRMLYWREVF